jgi:2,3-bisphosphoglycerate-independent phosphoglycerate mutase
MVKTAKKIDQTKYLILLGDGMGDYPIPRLKNRTVLESAHTPNMDFIAQRGILGQVQTIPASFTPGSDVANLSILGYDPRLYYTGRAPLEAASIGVSLAPCDVAFRCNFVTLFEGKMQDFSAGHISTVEGRSLIQEMDSRLGSAEFQFFCGTSYRHLLVWRGGKEQMLCTPPHDISGQAIDSHLPRGEGADRLLDLMTRSQDVLRDHPVNQERTAKGLPAANSIWLWGQGSAPQLPSFQEKYQKSGAIISAVDLLKGIGRYLGLEIIEVPGATGYLDTNYAAKADYALDALLEHDFVYVHVEAPDEAGHNGDLKAKIQAIEDFDRLVVGTVLNKISQFSSFQIMILPDHLTPVSVRTHTCEPVPFAIFPGQAQDTHLSNGKEEADKTTKKKRKFNEHDARSGIFIPEGHTLMDFFLQRREP